MQRIPEPELMDEFEQARAYAEADFGEPNERFVGYFETEIEPPRCGTVLDLGCGPGDIVLRLARRHPELCVHGLDGSAAMLEFGRARLRAEPALEARVRFVEGLLPGASLPLPRYDAVVSNSLLHHLHDPLVLWRAVRELGAPRAPVLVMDLYRPASTGVAQEIVEAYAGEEPEVLKRDFFNSLCAAFEPGEVREQLEACGLGSLGIRLVSDRHLLVAGRLPG
ncbi:MAG: class I SAM-dependent methyltransferase [Gammaproteobacteria bacterium]|nr:class I SAM-dependent methyltransferase [Gammaproteobacteria bacterium]